METRTHRILAALVAVCLVVTAGIGSYRLLHPAGRWVPLLDQEAKQGVLIDSTNGDYWIYDEQEGIWKRTVRGPGYSSAQATQLVERPSK